MTQEQIQKLLEIGIALSAEKNQDRLLEQILSAAILLTNCDAGTLYLKEESTLTFKIMRNNTLKFFEGGDGKIIERFPVSLSEDNVCTVAVLENKTIYIADIKNHAEYDFSDLLRYDKKMNYHTQSMLVVPMQNRSGEAIGVLQLINAFDQDGTIISFPADVEQIVKSVASQAAIAIENMHNLEATKNLFYSFVQVLSSAIDEMTPYNATHTRNMVRYADRFLDVWKQNHELTVEHKEEIIMSVWLHDIGKLVTPLKVMNKSSRLGDGTLQLIMGRLDIVCLQDEIAVLKGTLAEEEAKRRKQIKTEAENLIKESDTAVILTDEVLEKIEQIHQNTFVDTDGQTKTWLTDEEAHCLSIRRGTLTGKERVIMENHVSVTAKLLNQIQFSKEYKHVPFWASSHHEYINGTGYPKHLSGQELPFEVRLLTILDIFDALTADDRPYKKGVPVEEALLILQMMADQEGKLDSELTRAFIKSQCWKSGYLADTTSGA